MQQFTSEPGSLRSYQGPELVASEMLTAKAVRYILLATNVKSRRNKIKIKN